MRDLRELDKLEDYLKSHDIPYERIDKDGEYDKHQICFPKRYPGCVWDAICHYGSYGAEQGLLEIMGDIVTIDYDSVEGYLTADDVISRIEGKYNAAESF